MNEASTTRRPWTERELDALRGDPVVPGVRPLELEHGGGNVTSQQVDDRYDFVFSAHGVEHMHDPRAAILEWWQIVEPGGHLFVIVPDEDLDEQGVWPSVFNGDHETSLTISREASWSPVSVNVFDLIEQLPGAEVVDVRIHGQHDDRSLLRHRRHPRLWARLFADARWKLLNALRKVRSATSLHRFARVFQLPVERTAGDAAAQIQIIVRKRAAPHEGGPVEILR